jgi:PBP1b-binding outer membrane lipoprotein LpoB
MKKLARYVLVSAAALALAACGSSESAKEEAQADNVEILAEEPVGDLDPAATPVTDAAAAPGTATAPPAEDAAAAPVGAASDAAPE